MYLIYLDESGNTGLNLSDPAQPVFVLCAMLVDEEAWQPLEQALAESLDRRVPGWRDVDGFEIHGTELRTGRSVFRGKPVAERIALRDDWMAIGAAHHVRLIGVSTQKKEYADWQLREFGPGVSINPHVPAFALIARAANDFLSALPGRPRGILIADENKEIVGDVEKSVRVLRGDKGKLGLNRIIEKCFFIQSHKSLPLQLCDLYTLSVRKFAERQAGMPAQPVDDSGIEHALRLIIDGTDPDLPDLVAWLKQQHGPA